MPKKNWQTLGDLGLLALPFSEKLGGFGGGIEELALVFEEFGRGLVVEPYFASVVLAGGCLKNSKSAVAKDLLSNLLAGQMRLALACFEPGSGYDIGGVDCRATEDGEDFLLTGTKSAVLDGDEADFLIVSAVLGSADGEGGGVALFAIEGDSPGVRKKGYRAIDGSWAAEINLDRARVPKSQLLHPAKDGLAALIQTQQEALVCLGAELVGAMQALLNATVKYCKERRQFGSPIASFQVLQHRMVDMFIELEQSRSALVNAVVKMGANDPKSASAAWTLKARAGLAARLVGSEAVQLHGGMGVSKELPVGHYFKRMTMINQMFGDPD